MFAPLPGMREGEERTKEAVWPRAEECLITALSGFSQKKKKEGKK